jgi:hypothetical protein
MDRLALERLGTAGGRGRRILTRILLGLGMRLRSPATRIKS